MSSRALLAGVAAALLAAGAALAQEPAGYTLRDAIAEALEKNAGVQATRAGESAAAARLLEARAAWLPRVDATASFIRSDNPVFVFGSLLEQGRFGAQHFDPAFLNDPGALTNHRLSLGVRYAVFDQFRRWNATAQARKGVEQSAHASEEMLQRIRLETIQRYYGVLLAERRREVAADAVKSAEADAAMMRDRYEQGLLVESDLLSADVQAASFRQSLIEAEGDLAIARAALATVTGRPVSDSVRLDGAIPSKSFDTPELSDAIARAIENRGEILGARAASENASLQLQTARGSLLPRADAFATWGASRGDPDRAIGLVVSADLFDGAKYARIAQSRAALAEARAGEAGTRDRVTMEVVSAWYRTRAARERIAVAEQSAERAASASRIVHDRYEHGLTTITEQLRAQTAVLASRLELLAARYDYAVGHAELLRSTGELHDSF